MYQDTDSIRINVQNTKVLKGYDKKDLNALYGMVVQTTYDKQDG